MSDYSSRAKLIHILQLAYSGERAAGYAYHGHWNSVSDPDERTRIKAIEDEEWQHRKLVGEMLSSLEATPDSWREFRSTIIGKSLSLLCHLSFWFVPMYGAGKLESGNIVEYETAARHARDCGRSDLIECLLEMAEVEWEHERYFRERALQSCWIKVMKIWPQPPAKETIRASFHE